MGIKTSIVLLGLLAAGLAQAEYTDEERFNFTLDAGGRISVDNVNGDITVVSGSGNQVEIIALKRAKDKDALDDIEILVDARGDFIRVETKQAKSGGWFGWNNDGGSSVTYSLSVPATANLEGLESVNGDIDVKGVTGKIEVETVNGSIDVDSISSSVGLETVNGSINAHFLALGGEQRVDCESVNGKISLYLPDSFDAEVSAETVNGGIDGSDFGLETTKGFVGRDMSGTVGDGSARVRLNTVNGAIKLRKN